MILFFLVLLALKLAAIAVVYNTSPLFSLALIGSLIGLAHVIDSRQQQQMAREAQAAGSQPPPA